MRLLIIEDEEAIARPLKTALEKRNFAVDVCLDGESGLKEGKINEYDCIILDLNLPGIDGIEVAKQLRKATISTPILMLTARDMKGDLYSGFENGADDYLTKPFDFSELVYRLQALIRRHTGKTDNDTLLTISDISIDTAAIKVTKNNKPIALNKKEYGILEYLIRKRGIVVTQEELLEHVWDSSIDSFSQTVRTNMKTLRRKIDPDKTLIKTVKGYGYIIE